MAVVHTLVFHPLAFPVGILLGLNNDVVVCYDDSIDAVPDKKHHYLRATGLPRAVAALTDTLPMTSCDSRYVSVNLASTNRDRHHSVWSAPRSPGGASL